MLPGNYIPFWFYSVVVVFFFIFSIGLVELNQHHKLKPVTGSNHMCQSTQSKNMPMKCQIFFALVFDRLRLTFDWE